MNWSAKVTTTRVAGWKEVCRGWAEAGEPFEIQGIGARELIFCKELCVAFNYECRFDSKEAAAVFVPVA